MVSTAQVDQWVATAVVLVFAVFALRTVLGVGLTVVARCCGRADGLLARSGAAITPKLVRRLAVGLIGSAAVLGPAAAAQASPVVPDIDRGAMSAGSPAQSSPAPPAPASPAAASPAVGAPAPARDERAAASTRTVTVRAGDCLWSLAESQLGPRASPAHVQRQTDRWYRLNRATIGSEPDLIQTGHVLTVPRKTT